MLAKVSHSMYYILFCLKWILLCMCTDQRLKVPHLDDDTSLLSSVPEDDFEGKRSKLCNPGKILELFQVHTPHAPQPL